MRRGTAKMALRRMLAPITMAAVMIAAILTPASTQALPLRAKDRPSISGAAFRWGLFAIVTGTCDGAPSCVDFLASRTTLTPNQIQDMLSLVTGISLTVAAKYTALSDDPVDLNFTVVAPPVPGVPPALDPSTPASIVDLVSAETDSVSLLDAMDTAINRAEGAFVSDAPAFEQLQLNAYNGFELSLASDMDRAGMDIDDFVSSVGGLVSLLFGNIGDELVTDASGLTGSTTPADLAPAAVVAEPNSLLPLVIGIASLLCMLGVRQRTAV